MDSFNSTDSEFDSEAEDAECRLYAELYFGEERYEELLPVQNEKIIGLCSKSQNFVNENEEIGLAAKSNSVLNDVIHNDISEDTILNTSCVIEKCSADSNLNTVSNVDDSCIQFNSVGNVYKKHGRKNTKSSSFTINPRRRNISICSTDSISGKQPLDNLYCNYDSFDVPTSDIFMGSSLGPIAETNSSNNFEDTVHYSSEEESRYYIRPSKSKQLSRIKKTIPANTSDSGSSSDNEICIVPPDSPAFVETLTLDSDRSSTEESIQIVLDTPPSKKNEKRKKSAKNKICKKFNRTSSPISLSSEDSECEFLEATSTPMTSLTINVIKDMHNKNTTFKEKNIFKDRNKPKRNFVKSQVIFSKSRPLTKRKPSCSKWTAEMSSLYDSDISEDFDVESIHLSQTDEVSKWKIIAEDYNVRPQNRYFNKQVRCLRCREFGHHVSKCSKIPHCLYCGSASHTQINRCPDNCCLRCGEGIHGYCHLTNNAMICVLCRQPGHHAKLCPDIWRRFHATTKGSIPVRPKKELKRSEKRVAYCYNCGKKGHYGHECGSNNYKKYSLVTSISISYSPVSDILENISYYRPGPNGQMSGPSDDIEVENSLSVTTPALKESNGKDNHVVQRIITMNAFKTVDIISKIKYVKKEIIARSGVSMQYIFKPTKKSWKVIISGNNRSVLEAEKIMNILLGKIPAYEYSDLYSRVKDWNNLPALISFNADMNSGKMTNGTVTPKPQFSTSKPQFTTPKPQFGTSRPRFTPKLKATPSARAMLLHDSMSSIKNVGTLNQKVSEKSLINTGSNTKTKSKRSKKLPKKSLSPITDNNSLLQFAKSVTSSKNANKTKVNKFLNNSFIQSKKSSVISPRCRLSSSNGTTMKLVDRIFNDGALLEAAPNSINKKLDARNKINELRKSKESCNLGRPNDNALKGTPLNTNYSFKKKSKKSSDKVFNGGTSEKAPDAREIITLRKDSKVKISSVENHNNCGKVISNLSKFFIATSDAFETSKKKIKKTTKNGKIKVNCRLSYGRAKYVVNNNENIVKEIR